MNKAPDGYIVAVCDRCGARFTTQDRADDHGCPERFMVEK